MENPSRFLPRFVKKTGLVLLGAGLALLFLETGLRLTGGALRAKQNLSLRKALNSGGDVRLLCLGESTTAGGYPKHLEEILNRRQTKTRFTVIDAAYPGTTTSVILTQLEKNLEKYKPQLVVTMMGINDAEDDGFEHRPDPALSPASWRVTHLTKLVASSLRERFRKTSSPGDLRAAAGTGDAVQRLSPAMKTLLATIRHQRERQQFDDAVDSCRRALAIEPANVLFLLELAHCFSDRGMCAETEKICRDILRIDPASESASIEMAACYNSEGNDPKTVKLAEAVLKINPRSVPAFLLLATVHYRAGRHADMERACRNALAAQPRNVRAQVLLSKALKLQGRLDESPETLQEFISLKPGALRARLELAGLYCLRGNHEKAEKVCLQAVGLLSEGRTHPERQARAAVHGALGIVYSQMGRPIQAAEHFEMAEMDQNFSEKTRRNYLRLWETLARRQIVYVCASYPLRSTAPLKEIFGPNAGVLFVDNEKPFREVLKKEPFSKYFTDLFAGDFGHLTKNGDILLAENVADVVLKEFSKN
ncbi:MAG TPA: tetratricopeptide repeat protein [Elusimicrobiota bacterium]|nr:tetratricopeptide repeat protein [Elusimicrobiota bacterium]